ncbi:tetratricopeptide repeat protein [Legionella sp.]|uniref:tetratricopeptide repeat protein n=1 Tax=Legionella sp. TaxID=459 RepID=UPI003C802DFA
MKSLVPWVCLLAATASQQVWADDFRAYRLGNYNKAINSLMIQTGKNAVADYYLGRIYLYGYGQLKNTQLAVRYFTQSAQKGYLPAIQLLAKYALVYEKDPQQAVIWFKQAASAGDVNAQMFMAAAYLYGIGVKKNKDTASRYYIDAAKNGNSIAQFTLAEDFINSRNSSNNKLGLIWLNKAANNGNPQALTKLGDLYISGKLVEHNAAKGMELLNQAVAQGFAPAMVKLSKIALEQNQKDEALQWINKVGNYENNEASLEVAEIYLDAKNPIYNPHIAFMWTLKTAQNGSTDGKRRVSELYKKGIGVDVDLKVAQQWLNQANQEDKSTNSSKAIAEAALWLSNGTTNKLEKTAYQMNGIFGEWNNPAVLGDYAYNQAPKLKTMSRRLIFKPQFELVQPNEVPITSYYNALLSKNGDYQSNQWTYPMYPLNPQAVIVERANSPIIAHLDLPVPYIDARYPELESQEASLMDLWTDEWKQQLNIKTVFYQLYNRAILGDAQAQFEIGQMFQYGIGVAQNNDAAIIFYQNAVQQQHLGAEYNLGILYLLHAKGKEDYQMALNDLTDAAFKGNKKSQYVLARILEQGITGPEGTEYIKADPEQANSMLYLAAANGDGSAQYDLANHLVRQYDSGLNVDTKKFKIALIRQLYQGAADRGISNALLPLAFYNAMDSNPQKQAQAFVVAKEQAEAGDEKAALLLGLLYDRGIGVSADPGQAIHWYQQAGQNAVSQFILGTYAAEGKGLEKNKDRAMAQLQQSMNDKFSYADFNRAVLQYQTGEEFLPALIDAYELGNSHAGIVLADYYLAANDDPEKMKQARRIYEGLADKGDQDAQLKLAYMSEQGLGSAPDIAGAQRWYTASAEQGNSLAEYLLGQFYQVGEQGDPDYTLAKQWYQKAAATLPEALVALGFIDETVDDNYAQAFKVYEQAAAQGNGLGIYNLALMYLYGKGIPVDFEKAKSLFLEAANKENSEAMNQLASIYFTGLGGLPRDAQQALAWYKKASEMGNANALYELGLLSETGVTTKLDFNEALKYYQAAADKGNEKAMLALARMYHYGLGVAKNPKIAASYYEKLALRQNAYAQYQLGTYYLEGTAGEQSLTKGKQLLQQASDNGSLQARKLLLRMEASQDRVSFIEPIVMNQAPIVAGETANLIYLNALNVWNRGDEVLSRMILQQLVTQFPDFVPAKQIYEQVNQAKLENIYS